MRSDVVNARLEAILDHFHVSLAFGLMPALAIALIAALLCGFFGRTAFVAAGFAFGLFGAATGMMIGASRDPAVTAVLPAIVTLAGGLAAYLFPASKAGQSLLSDITDDAERSRFTRGFILSAVTALAASSVTGANFGASVRSANEAFQRDLLRDQMLFEQIELPLERLQVEELLRRAGQIPQDPDRIGQ